MRKQFNCVQNNTIQETVWRIKQGDGKSLKESISITEQNENTLTLSQLYEGNNFQLWAWKLLSF